MMLATVADVTFTEARDRPARVAPTEGPAPLRWDFAGPAQDASAPESPWRGAPFLLSEPVAFACELVVADAAGTRLRSLRVVFTQRVVAANSFHLVGSDASGFLAVRLALHEDLSSVQLGLRPDPSGKVTPADLLPPIRFIEALEPSRQIGLWLPRPQRWGTPPVLIGQEVPELPDEYADVVRALAHLQDVTGVRFPMPTVINSIEANTLDRVLRLLEGETLKGTWTRASVTLGAEQCEALQSASGPHGFLFEFTSAYEIELSGNSIHVGTARHRFRQATIVGQQRARNSEGLITVMLAPGEDHSYEIELLSTAGDDSDDNAAVTQLPMATLERYAGRWIAQQGTEVLFDDETPEKVIRALRSSGQTATIWRVPATKLEAESTPGVGT